MIPRSKLKELREKAGRMNNLLWVNHDGDVCSDETPATILSLLEALEQATTALEQIENIINDGVAEQGGLVAYTAAIRSWARSTLKAMYGEKA